MRVSKKQKKIVCYDSGDDSLTFINDNLGIKTINTGETLITLDKKGKITALEFMGAHKNFNIPKNVLKGLKKANLNISLDKEKKRLFINITLLYEDKPKEIMHIKEDISHIKEAIMENQKAASFYA